MRGRFERSLVVIDPLTCIPFDFAALGERIERAEQTSRSSAQDRNLLTSSPRFQLADVFEIVCVCCRSHVLLACKASRPA